MLCKKILYGVVFSFLSIAMAHASQQQSNDQLQLLKHIAADMQKIKTDSTADALHNCADAIREVSNNGIKIEHSFKMPNTYQAILGFTTCLSTYALWRGVNNYWYAHRGSQKAKDPNAYEAKNRKAAVWQMSIGAVGLLGSLVSLVYSK